MQSFIHQQKLLHDFYSQDVLDVARRLIGKLLVRIDGDHVLSGMIVETEAYDSHSDEASHSFKGKNRRNEVMFDNGGVLYVYLIYGMYYCCNVVTGNAGDGKAVLIRAVEPVSGIPEIKHNRFGLKHDINEINLSNGPGKLCRAFNIDNKDNGTDLTGDRIFITTYTEVNNSEIKCSPRVGITKSVDLPWRFYLNGNKFVSKSKFKT